MINEEVLELFESAEMTTTNNINEAIFILPGGELINGDVEYGVRGTDHNVIGILYDDLDRCSNDTFWSEIVKRTNILQYVPETQIVLQKEGQIITMEQSQIIEKYQLEVELY
ncbi:hypothetical protein [Staphylococcus capitis]|uniref:hypothetical protein n=1 Tax=Staphylococcus capitis TaxID=29388 RepID=UPI0030BDEB5C